MSLPRDSPLSVLHRKKTMKFRLINSNLDPDSMSKKIFQTVAQELNVKQLKAVVAQIAELVPATKAEAEKLRVERDAAMGHIGNLLGPDVPISNDEDADNAIVRMVGDVKLEQKYRFVSFDQYTV